MKIKTYSMTALFTGLALVTGCSDSKSRSDIKSHYEFCERAATSNERTRILQEEQTAPNGIVWLPQTQEEARRETIIRCLEGPTIL